MPFTGGFVGIIPALNMIQSDPSYSGTYVDLNWLTLTLWCMAIAFFGVFFAVPLRKEMVKF
jgi:uncharacterized oligopeptide transporter (OPT) family protein